ncbi:MAG: hypothetical protein NC924_06180 [Candidatus Omnitrophica bacterium]|nr:hypothetical protein [Candidatus Omnitrophota bacterium]
MQATAKKFIGVLLAQALFLSMMMPGSAAAATQARGTRQMLAPAMSLQVAAFQHEYHSIVSISRQTISAASELDKNSPAIEKFAAAVIAFEQHVIKTIGKKASAIFWQKVIDILQSVDFESVAQMVPLSQIELRKTLRDLLIELSNAYVATKNNLQAFKYMNLLWSLPDANLSYMWGRYLAELSANLGKHDDAAAFIDSAYKLVRNEPAENREAAHYSVMATHATVQMLWTDYLWSGFNPENENVVEKKAYLTNMRTAFQELVSLYSKLQKSEEDKLFSWIATAYQYQRLAHIALMENDFRDVFVYLKAGADALNNFQDVEGYASLYLEQRARIYLQLIETTSMALRILFTAEVQQDDLMESLGYEPKLCEQIRSHFDQYAQQAQAAGEEENPQLAQMLQRDVVAYSAMSEFAAGVVEKILSDNDLRKVQQRVKWQAFKAWRAASLQDFTTALSELKTYFTIAQKVKRHDPVSEELFVKHLLTQIAAIDPSSTRSLLVALFKISDIKVKVASYIVAYLDHYADMDLVSILNDIFEKELAQDKKLREIFSRVLELGTASPAVQQAAQVASAEIAEIALPLLAKVARSYEALSNARSNTRGKQGKGKKNQSNGDAAIKKWQTDITALAQALAMQGAESPLGSESAAYFVEWIGQNNLSTKRIIACAQALAVVPCPATLDIMQNFREKCSDQQFLTIIENTQRLVAPQVYFDGFLSDIEGVEVTPDNWQSAENEAKQLKVQMDLIKSKHASAKQAVESAQRGAGVNSKALPVLPDIQELVDSGQAALTALQGKITAATTEAEKNEVLSCYDTILSATTGDPATYAQGQRHVVELRQSFDSIAVPESLHDDRDIREKRDECMSALHQYESAVAEKLREELALVERGVSGIAVQLREIAVHSVGELDLSDINALVSAQQVALNELAAEYAAVIAQNPDLVTAMDRTLTQILAAIVLAEKTVGDIAQAVEGTDSVQDISIKVNELESSFEAAWTEMIAPLADYKQALMVLDRAKELLQAAFADAADALRQLDEAEHAALAVGTLSAIGTKIDDGFANLVSADVLSLAAVLKGFEENFSGIDTANAWNKLAALLCLKLNHLEKSMPTSASGKDFPDAEKCYQENTALLQAIVDQCPTSLLSDEAVKKAVRVFKDGLDKLNNLLENTKNQVQVDRLGKILKKLLAKVQEKIKHFNQVQPGDSFDSAAEQAAIENFAQQLDGIANELLMYLEKHIVTIMVGPLRALITQATHRIAEIAEQQYEAESQRLEEEIKFLVKALESAGEESASNLKALLEIVSAHLDLGSALSGQESPSPLQSAYDAARRAVRANALVNKLNALNTRVQESRAGLATAGVDSVVNQLESLQLDVNKITTGEFKELNAECIAAANFELAEAISSQLTTLNQVIRAALQSVEMVRTIEALREEITHEDSATISIEELTNIYKAIVRLRADDSEDDISRLVDAVEVDWMRLVIRNALAVLHSIQLGLDRAPKSALSDAQRQMIAQFTDLLAIVRENEVLAAAGAEQLRDVDVAQTTIDLRVIYNELLTFNQYVQSGKNLTAEQKVRVEELQKRTNALLQGQERAQFGNLPSSIGTLIQNFSIVYKFQQDKQSFSSQAHALIAVLHSAPSRAVSADALATVVGRVRDQWDALNAQFRNVAISNDQDVLNVSRLVEQAFDKADAAGNTLSQAEHCLSVLKTYINTLQEMFVAVNSGNYANIQLESHASPVAAIKAYIEKARQAASSAKSDYSRVNAIGQAASAILSEIVEIEPLLAGAEFKWEADKTLAELKKISQGGDRDILERQKSLHALRQGITAVRSRLDPNKNNMFINLQMTGLEITFAKMEQQLAHALKQKRENFLRDYRQSQQRISQQLDTLLQSGDSRVQLLAQYYELGKFLKQELYHELDADLDSNSSEWPEYDEAFTESELIHERWENEGQQSFRGGRLLVRVDNPDTQVKTFVVSLGPNYNDSEPIPLRTDAELIRLFSEGEEFDIDLRPVRAANSSAAQVLDRELDALFDDIDNGEIPMGSLIDNAFGDRKNVEMFEQAI